MNITYEDSKKFSVDKDKLITLTIIDRWFYRPIAIWLNTVLFNLFKLTPNKISIVSMVVVSMGFLFIIFNTNKYFVMLGSLFLMLFMVLDCADGSLARTLFYKYNLKNPLGEFFDAFVGYFVISGLWTSLGYYLTISTDNNIWFILGTLSSLASLYSRTAYLKLGWVKCKQGLDKEQDKKIREGLAIKIYKNIDWGGFLLPCITFAIWLECLEYILIFMMFVNIAMLLWMFRHAYYQSKKFPMYKIED